MAQPYVGEIRMFAGNFAPAGWMFCEGQLLPISENETLFQLIGTTYGGDGESTFALPDLRGRIPIHQGNGFILAETGGAEEITLTVNQIPAHSHPMLANSNNGSLPDPANNVVAKSTTANVDLYWRMCRRPTWRPKLSVLSAAASRTPISSPICASTTSSRCSGSSRRRPEEDAMADPFVAEIRIFPFNFAPKGWAWCDGQLLPLSQNTALFSLLGTTYGGNGKSNFALPDLQGRAAMHPGQGPGLSLHDLGETGGSETVTLLESEIPAHSHTLRAANSLGDNPNPAGHSLARYTNAYQSTVNANLVSMSGQALAPAGGDQPHNNLQPYLTFYFCIALQGVFPPRG